MINEPKIIYLNCFDEAETDESYLPIDNDFDSLDGENVLWSADHPCLGGNINYVHHSEVDELKDRISKLEAENAKLKTTLINIRDRTIKQPIIYNIITKALENEI